MCNLIFLLCKSTIRIIPIFSIVNVFCFSTSQHFDRNNDKFAELILFFFIRTTKKCVDLSFNAIQKVHVHRLCDSQSNAVKHSKRKRNQKFYIKKISCKLTLRTFLKKNLAFANNPYICITYAQTDTIDTQIFGEHFQNEPLLPVIIV